MWGEQGRLLRALLLRKRRAGFVVCMNLAPAVRRHLAVSSGKCWLRRHCVDGVALPFFETITTLANFVVRFSVLALWGLCVCEFRWHCDGGK